MRIMIVSTTYSPAMNGQAVFTTNLAEGLAKRGHKAMVVLDSPTESASHEVVNGVQLERIRSISLGIFHQGVHFSPFPGRDILSLVRSFKPEVIHIQDHYPTCRAAVGIARKLHIKLLGSNHFIPENLAPYIPILSKIKPVFNWILWQWMLEVYRRVDAVTAQSAASARILKSQGLRMPILPISCGIDLHRFYPNPAHDREICRRKYSIDPQRKVFLFLGRIDGEKHVDLLLRAAKCLGRKDILFVIAGDGKVEEQLRHLVTALGIQEQVIFTGFIPNDDVPGLMNSVDVFVMPSEAELLSISTLEAMACGKPVLLADALALPELVKPGVNGYLFKPGDVADLTRLIGELADHPERWPEMGAASREFSLAHSLDAVIHQFEDLYQSLVSNPGFSEVKQPIEERI